MSDAILRTCRRWRRLTWVCVLSSAACSFAPGASGVAGAVGPVGPPGPVGALGPRGPQGPSLAGQLVYRDAAGTLVGKGSPVFVDARGFLWRIEPETGAPGPMIAVKEIAYDAADCGGQAFARPAPEPRMPLQIPGEAGFGVRPDALRLPETVVFSYRTNLDAPCQTYAEPLQDRLLPLTPATLPNPPIAPAAVSFVPPLHRERE